jgi:ADP-ribose pyrophosphatase YjhB (NUDIX family)
MTIRETRLQAAIVRDGCLLLVRCTAPFEPPFWVLPGGGREAGESDAEAVAREVLEELGVTVEVGVVIDDVQADPPDGTYARWRTFACRLTGGRADGLRDGRGGGADGGAVAPTPGWRRVGRGAPERPVPVPTARADARGPRPRWCGAGVAPSANGSLRLTKARNSSPRQHRSRSRLRR